MGQGKKASSLLVVLSGPSGVGKDTVLASMKRLDRPWHFVVTATTRPRRPQERDGVDYWFLTPSGFRDLLAQEGFLEDATVYGYLYGVPRAQVEEALRSGRDVIVKTDVQGARTLRAKVPDALLIFLAPPSFQELERRLRERKTESSEGLQRRIETARQELACQGEFDHVVVNENGRLEETVAAIEAIIARTKQQRSRQRRSAMKENISLFEAIYTQRGIRRFSPEPVPDEATARIIEAAVRAPNPGNRQPWYFLVIRDAELKGRIGEYYWRATEEAQKSPEYARIAHLPIYQAADDLARRIGEVPVLILACVEVRGDSAGPSSRGPISYGAAIYPAVQNLMLAARALGLGTCLTTRHRRFEKEVKQLLGIPDHVETVALIPVGYPGGGDHFGGSRRKPAREVTFYDRWGQKRES